MWFKMAVSLKQVLSSDFAVMVSIRNNIWLSLGSDGSHAFEEKCWLLVGNRKWTAVSCVKVGVLLTYPFTPTSSLCGLCLFNAGSSLPALYSSQQLWSPEDFAIWRFVCFVFGPPAGEVFALVQTLHCSAWHNNPLLLRLLDAVQCFQLQH